MIDIEDKGHLACPCEGGRNKWKEKIFKVEFKETSDKWKNTLIYRLKGHTMFSENWHRMTLVTYPTEFYWTSEINNPLSVQVKRSILALLFQELTLASVFSVSSIGLQFKRKYPLLPKYMWFLCVDNNCGYQRCLFGPKVSDKNRKSLNNKGFT